MDREGIAQMRVKGLSSNGLRIEGSGEKSSSPGRRAVLGKQRPISPQFTLWFDGPRALHAFQECVNALSPCSYRAVQIGSHTKVSFDDISEKARNRAMKRAAK